jgi:Gluconate 2-dehydrogenase subunit 3
MEEQTRRNWLITIGQATVGLSVAGWLPCYSADAVTLPPGVYLPSKDHLSHALMNAERYHPIPPGCPTDYVRPADASSHPLFFSEPEFREISRLVHLLLGNVSDESAPQEVARWVDLCASSATAVREALANLQPLHRTLATAYFGSTEEVRHQHGTDLGNVCREGLNWLQASAREQYSTDFLSLGEEQQLSLLRSISDEVSGQTPANAGNRFFNYLKSETIRGYYTSRAGLQELDYKGNSYYARSPGCNSQ